MCDSLTCYSAPEIMEGAELLLLFFRACLTCCLSSCSPSPSLCWQQLSCPRSAALCSMATIWQSSTLLQRLVPLHPTPSVRWWPNTRKNDDRLHNFDPGAADHYADHTESQMQHNLYIIMLSCGSVNQLFL